MQGASRGSLVSLRTSLGHQLGDGGDAATISRELFAVTEVLASSAALRRALVDTSRDTSARTGLVDRVFGGKVSDATLGLVREAVGQRWSSDRDLVDAAEEIAVAAAFGAAERRGRLDQVEEELFRFERTVAGDPGLRDALLDRQRSGADKAALVKKLLDGKAEQETIFLAERAASFPRGRRFERVIADYLRTAASVRDELTATVTVARPLEPAQKDRLTQGLSRLYNRSIVTNVIVDPQVVGGIRVQVGDEVIDGTILSRLEEVRRTMAG
ncbi:F0F1 ATP synthase subunit delta [Calidifontibacter sp. DB0510]|uniref:ATP synthase subunit delta n=1 Tax=Metallococcus carri TaxID=1656884 RepID=A0A967E9G9_9MICO|nr:F0F1 ATP synthase subunit delta [Metallococcus carri]NHN56372.1 F0F1 ATP synthase subunit delta [Metallococcus carri]